MERCTANRGTSMHYGPASASKPSIFPIRRITPNSPPRSSSPGKPTMKRPYSNFLPLREEFLFLVPQTNGWPISRSFSRDVGHSLVFWQGEKPMTDRHPLAHPECYPSN